LFSLCRHCRCFTHLLPVSDLHASTFLPPFPRHGLCSPCFQRLSPLRYYEGSDSCPPHPTGSSPRLLHDAFRPFRLQPPDAPLPQLSHATPQLDRSPSPGRGFAVLLAGSPIAPGRIEFVILRTGRSPPVAPHPASRRRSYVRLQARRAIDLKRTRTFPTSCPHGRTRSGALAAMNQPECPGRTHRPEDGPPTRRGRYFSLLR
jgi:hypothetical protein